MSIFNNFKNKKVLITGHTGFKGSWLNYWLKILDAEVMGISIDPPSKPSHHSAIKNFLNFEDEWLDISILKKFKKKILKFKPDYIFHLAAQSLVSDSHTNPVETWNTNLIGTLNLLESVRSLNKNCIVIIITSDKCYYNVEKKTGYKEHERLGGKDNYSASKASAEILIHSYINSFFSNKNNKVRIATARAGNVVGGGDWAKNRLIPDFFKNWHKNRKVLIRNPKSTRPWQHVLEALSGYLTLASKLKKNKKINGQSFNFGPKVSSCYTVKYLVNKMNNKLNNRNLIKLSKSKNKFKESNFLMLDCSKSRKILKWKTILSFDEMVKFIVKWYVNFYKNPKNIHETTRNQIREYQFMFEKGSSK